MRLTPAMGLMRVWNMSEERLLEAGNSMSGFGLRDPRGHLISSSYVEMGFSSLWK